MIFRRETTKKISILFVMLSCVVTVSCASTTGSRYGDGVGADEGGGLTILDEQRMAEETLPELQREYPPAGNEELQRYVSRLGTKIVRANNLEGNPYFYEFTVVADETVNAFALPAGKIFVTVPLIAMVANEAELAGILGHEIGHVIAGHATGRMYALEKSRKERWLYAAGGGVAGVAAGLVAGVVFFPVGCAVGTGGVFLLRSYNFSANSRQDELDADRIGFEFAVRAGYDKDHVGTFYENVLRVEEGALKSRTPLMKILTEILDTHPPSRERVRQMRELASGSPAAETPMITSPEFERARTVAAEWRKGER